MSDNLAKVLQFPEDSKEKNDFISFIELCADTKVGVEIVTEFHKIVDGEDVMKLKEWFTSKGFSISEEECDRCIKNRHMLRDFRTNINNNGY